VNERRRISTRLLGETPFLKRDDCFGGRSIRLAAARKRKIAA
jgi:hypothetical protein